jgi:hypothetical protein
VHVTIEDQIAERDNVVTRFTLRGTHQGEFMGVPATGKVVTVTGIYMTLASRRAEWVCAAPPCRAPGSGTTARWRGRQRRGTRSYSVLAGV